MPHTARRNRPGQRLEHARSVHPQGSEVMTMTVRTIPVTDVQPGDLVDAGSAERPGPVIVVRQVATIGERTYVLRREPGELVPESYVFPAGRRVDVYSRTA